MIFELSDNISIDEDLFSAICSKTMFLALKWDYMPLNWTKGFVLFKNTAVSFHFFTLTTVHVGYGENILYENVILSNTLYTKL